MDTAHPTLRKLVETGAIRSGKRLFSFQGTSLGTYILSLKCHTTDFLGTLELGDAPFEAGIAAFNVALLLGMGRPFELCIVEKITSRPSSNSKKTSTSKFWV